MKTLSMIKESFDNQPLGNKVGVTNHLTPVDNIVTNVRNFFSSQLSMVVTKAEDNFSLKCTSSLWHSEEDVRNAIYTNVWNDRTSLFSYVSMQGLSCIKIVPVGEEYFLYFCPSDIKQSYGYNCTCDNESCESLPKIACHEQKQLHLGDVEYNQFGEIKEDAWQPDQEIEDTTKKDIRQLLASNDKVKAAKAFAEILKQNMRMPENYYITAVRDEDGNESVALRYKHDVRKPFGKTATVTKTLVNIYGLGDNGIWVNDADNPNGMDQELKGVIDDMLGFIGVRRTGDACCFTIAEDPSTADDLKSDPNSSDNKDDNNDNNKENNKDQDTEQKNKDDNGQGINTPQRTDKPSQVAANQADNSLSNSGIMRTDGSSM